MTIPDDIKASAQAAIEEGWGIGDDGGSEFYETIGVEAVARAILAERQRCADVARGGWGYIGPDIADAITA